MPQVDLWLIAAVAAFAGSLGAMLGIGGGIILVPVLISFFGVDAIHARTASLVAVCVTSLAGSLVYLKEGATDLVAVSYMQLPTAIGAIAGAIVGSRLDDKVIRLLFAILVVIVGFRMLFAENVNRSEIPPAKRQWAYAAIACVAAGVVSSLLGVGGGLIFVPVLTLLLGMEQRNASATSTYLIGMTAAASALIYQAHGQMEPRITVAAALGILVGAQVGARMSKVFSGIWLRRIFALVMFVNAYMLLQRVVLNWTA